MSQQRSGVRTHRVAKPPRRLPQQRHGQREDSVPVLTEAQMLQEMREIVGEDRVKGLSSLLRQRVKGDKSQPQWVKERKLDALVHLYAQLPGVTADEILDVLASLNEESSDAVVRRLDDVLVPLLPHASTESILRLLPRWRSLTELQAQALGKGRCRALVEAIERHQEVGAWLAQPTPGLLQKVASSTEEVKDLYFTLVEDALRTGQLRPHPWGMRTEVGDETRRMYEKLYDLAQATQFGNLH